MATSMPITNSTASYFLLPSFVDIHDQRLLVEEALQRHYYCVTNQCQNHCSPSNNISNKPAVAATISDNGQSLPVLQSNTEVNDTRDNEIIDQEGITICKDQDDSLNKIYTLDCWKHLQVSTSSIKLQTGVKCGGNLAHVLPTSALIAYQAFQHVSETLERKNNNKHSTNSVHSRHPLTTISWKDKPLYGAVLLYGLNASMSAHYDSPTQPGQKHEWLVNITLGNTVRFKCNDDVLELKSGDILVMDSMAVLHGVIKIEDDCNCSHVDNQFSTVLQPFGTEQLTSNMNDKINTKCNYVHMQIGLPFPSRLGILFWQGSQKTQQQTINKTLHYPLLDYTTVDANVDVLEENDFEEQLQGLFSNDFDINDQQ